MKTYSEPLKGNNTGWRWTLLIAGLWLACSANAELFSSALDRPSLIATAPEKSYLLDISQAGNRLVAVGERGIVLISDDNGVTWRQAATPVSVTLTAVSFADARNGYAVGHGATVLLTQDAGENWALSLDGRTAAQLLLKAAEAKGEPREIAEAQQLVEDGPDKPLLDIWVRDPLNAFAVGAYGLALRTDDGGKSWHPWLNRSVNPGGLHLNAIRSRGPQVLIAGEQGLALLSVDGGINFRTLEPPYSGSFFTAELASDGSLLIAGLRGNALRSNDNGASWISLGTPVDASITASTLQADGAPIFVNQAGMILRERSGRLLPINRSPLPSLNNLLLTESADIVLVSGEGVSLLTAGDVK